MKLALTLEADSINVQALNKIGRASCRERV